MFFLKKLVDTCPFLGPLIPLFQTSGGVSAEFQSRNWQTYSHVGEGLHDICSLRFPSGDTSLPVYIASIAPCRNFSNFFLKQQYR